MYRLFLKAFKAWKKKKDEFLKQQKINVQNKKEEMNMESFMDDREKKMEADAAFSAWRDHKSHSTKMNKKRRAWIMQKQKEEENKKIRRDKEALHMYDLWLENKNSPAKRKASDLGINKPPWSPPGKSSFISQGTMSLVNVALYHIHHIWHYRVHLRESGQPIGRLRKTCKNAFPRTIPVSFGRLDTPIATESSL
ncbi:hypothetical protein TNCV_5064011 [Trichonephila clavipes]|nr:hypothetical protein TNCV_5064011 [Trichonephila clavipes]